MESFPICIIECNNVRCNKWEVRHFTSGVSIIICNNWFPLGFVIKMPPVSLVVEDMKLNMQMLSANPQPHITKCFTSGILIGAGQTGSLSSILQYQPLNKYWTVLCYLDDDWRLKTQLSDYVAPEYNHKIISIGSTPSSVKKNHQFCNWV